MEFTFFPLEEALLWIMDWYFSQKRQFNVKTVYYLIGLDFSQTYSFSLYKTLSDWLESW